MIYRKLDLKWGRGGKRLSVGGTSTTNLQYLPEVPEEAKMQAFNTRSPLTYSLYKPKQRSQLPRGTITFFVIPPREAEPRESESQVV